MEKRSEKLNLSFFIQKSLKLNKEEIKHLNSLTDYIKKSVTAAIEMGEIILPQNTKITFIKIQNKMDSKKSNLHRKDGVGIFEFLIHINLECLNHVNKDTRKIIYNQLNNILTKIINNSE